jgi:hypothetical protein
MDDAGARIKALAKQSPGKYVIRNSATGEEICLNVPSDTASCLDAFVSERHAPPNECEDQQQQGSQPST